MQSGDASEALDAGNSESMTNKGPQRDESYDMPFGMDFLRR
jgi:hypothetical protein